MLRRGQRDQRWRWQTEGRVAGDARSHAVQRVVLDSVAGWTESSADILGYLDASSLLVEEERQDVLVEILRDRHAS